MSRGDDSNRQCQCALPVSTTRASHGGCSGALMHGALTILLESLPPATGDAGAGARVVVPGHSAKGPKMMVLPSRPLQRLALQDCV